jgi:hypothetical protein
MPGVPPDHVPPVVASVSVVVKPTQTEATPPIAAGVALTVTVAVREHPVVGSVVIMVPVPGTIPETTPFTSTVKFDDVVLHITPGVRLLSVVVRPGHTDNVPLIAEGSALIVMFAVV